MINFYKISCINSFETMIIAAYTGAEATLLASETLYLTYKKANWLSASFNIELLHNNVYDTYGKATIIYDNFT